MIILRKHVAPSDCNNCSHRILGMFCNLAPETLAELNSVGRIISVPSGAIITREDEPADRVLILCEGQVKLSCTSREGRTLNLKIAIPGEVIGLSAVISGSPFEVTAEAILPTTVNIVRRDDFLAFIQRHGEASMHASQALALEYKAAFSDARSLALSGTVAGRVASLLLGWGRAASCGELEMCFHMALTHDDLANFAGTTRESITRTLGKFQKDKLIEIRGASVHILAPKKLEDLVA